MSDDDEKTELYKQIVEQTNPWMLLERMRELGFWPEDADVPEEPADERKERERLEDEVARLRNKGTVVANPDEALKKERLRRWKESKTRRILRRQDLEKERQARREAFEAKKKASVVHLGDGVSAGLEERESDVARLERQGLPVLHTPEEFAGALDISLGELRWLTFHRRSVAVVHYQRYAIPKKTGGERQISAPKPRLAAAQRWVLNSVLGAAAVSDHAHGFVPGRNTVSGATPHVGQAVVVNLDLKDFFPSIGFRRVKGLFRALGYSESVATVLGLLCTEPPRTPAALDDDIWWVSLGARQLPQGACTSPQITNLICRRLDGRLAGIARHQGFAFSRYADDLTFSGDDVDKLPALLGSVRRVITSEGFTINEDKTRVMRSGRQQEVTGLTVNAKVAISRKERRRLRAMLHEARVKGLKAANRHDHPRFAEHLRGLVAYVTMVHPEQRDRWAAELSAALSSKAAPQP